MLEGAINEDDILGPDISAKKKVCLNVLQFLNIAIANYLLLTKTVAIEFTKNLDQLD